VFSTAEGGERSDHFFNKWNDMQDGKTVR